jgi:hypothetical protein
MPNWCDNTMVLQHKDPAMIKRALESFNDDRFLQEFIPVPDDLQIVAGSVGDPVEQAELEAKSKANQEKYGYDNWYSYCVSEWGTKWDIGSSEYGSPAYIDKDDPSIMHATFGSAWSPPIQGYGKLYDLGFSVRAYYYEPGMGFCGIWDDGVDDYYEIGGMSSTEVADTIPSELDEMFGISENIADWEAENRDEVQEWYEDGVEKQGLEPHKELGEENK